MPLQSRLQLSMMLLREIVAYAEVLWVEQCAGETFKCNRLSRRCAMAFEMIFKEIFSW